MPDVLLSLKYLIQGGIILSRMRRWVYISKGKIGMKMTKTLDHLSPLDPFCVTPVVPCILAMFTTVFIQILYSFRPDAQMQTCKQNEQFANL